MRTCTRAARPLLVRAGLLAVALACVGSGGAEAQAPQEQETAFSAAVDMVLLHVAVIDPRGGEIPPLTPEDFTVFDDGVKQDIKLFVTPTDAPLDVAMVLDSSASMKPVEVSARRAALTFLNKLALDDCVYALPFNDTSGPGRWGRSADPMLRGFVGTMRASGGTALHDAVLAGLAKLQQANANELVALANEAALAVGPEDDGDAVEPVPGSRAAPPDPSPTAAPDIVMPPRRTSLLDQVDGVVRTLDLNTPPPVRGCGESLPAGSQTTAANARRKALLLLSDGADMDSDAGFYDALGAARASSVPVFPVAMGYANDEPELKANLAELARATGGRLIENTEATALGASYDEVVALLRSYYLIGYDPSRGQGVNDGRARWHDVSVELRRPNFEPLVRPGYYR